MGLGSHTQISDRSIAMAFLLDTAVAEACTGRAAGTGNPTRPATTSRGGAA